jgi:hypothetical protein
VSLFDELSNAIQQALYGMSFDAWMASWQASWMRLRMCGRDVGALLVVGFVMRAFMMSLNNKQGAAMIKPIMWLSVLSRVLAFLTR